MRVAIAFVAVTACYRPNAATESCALLCNTAADCPSDLTCNNDGVCSPDGQACVPVTPDGGGDDGNSGAFCAGDPLGLLGRVCFPTPPPASEFPGGTSHFIDTNGDACDARPLLVDACLVVVNQIGGTIRATGSRPLVLWALGELVLASTLDVASHGMGPGPGVATNCPSVGIDGTLVGTVGGGGAGGTFGSIGGNGGPVGTSGGGVAIASIENNPPLHGGCSGGFGANTNAQLENAGLGGGAVYLMAADKIIVTASGLINASGGGGLGGANPRGGGGAGGTGGMIGFDAPSIEIDGIVLALGGGGASGGGNTTPGIPGNEPSVIAPHPAEFTGSIGGCAGVGAGGGGSNGAGGAEDGQESSGSCAGGGGGGGDGVIRTFGTLTLSGTLMPTPL